MAAIRGYRPSLANVRNHRARLELVEAPPEGQPDLRGPNDPLVVMGFEINALLQPLIDLGGVVWLANKIGVDESLVRRQLGLDCMGLGRLDEWLIKLGLQNALYDNTLHVVPNPHWTFERYVEHFRKWGDDPPDIRIGG